MPKINLSGMLKDHEGAEIPGLGYVTSTEGNIPYVIERLQDLISNHNVKVVKDGYGENSNTLIKYNEREFHVDYVAKKQKPTDYAIEDVIEAIDGLIALRPKLK